MKIRLIIVLSLGILTIVKGKQTIAQETTENNKGIAQVTFAYPIGSRGISSPSYSNYLSLNSLYGINGGVNGVEVDGLVNGNKGNVNGIQIAGIGNFNVGKTDGMMLAGMINLSAYETKAIQLSGVYNSVGDNSVGIQTAVFNTAWGDYTGLQIGVINSAKKLKGLQIGVINVVEDGEKAIPIGLVNIVKNGYYAVEHTSNESLPLNLSFKMGVESFYTILRICASSYLEEPVYGAGIGFGGNIPVAERSSITIDLTTNNLEYRTIHVWEGINSLNKLELSYKFHLNEKFAIMAGPSYNAYVSNIQVENEYGTLNPLLVLSSTLKADRLIQTWLGFSVGLSVTL